MVGPPSTLRAHKLPPVVVEHRHSPIDCVLYRRRRPGVSHVSDFPAVNDVSVIKRGAKRAEPTAKSVNKSTQESKTAT